MPAVTPSDDDLRRYLSQLLSRPQPLSRDHSNTDAWMVVKETDESYVDVPESGNLHFAAESALLISQTGSQLCPWIVDSGSTSHMTGYLADFGGVALAPISQGHRIRIADGTHLCAAGRGLVRTLVPTTAGVMVNMNVVAIFVPGLAARLFSVRKACERSADVVLRTSGSFICRAAETIPIEVRGSTFVLAAVFCANPPGVLHPPESLTHSAFDAALASPTERDPSELTQCLAFDTAGVRMLVQTP